MDNIRWRRCVMEKKATKITYYLVYNEDKTLMHEGILNTGEVVTTKYTLETFNTESERETRKQELLNI
jgi:hypothetical protein